MVEVMDETTELDNSPLIVKKGKTAKGVDTCGSSTAILIHLHEAEQGCSIVRQQSLDEIEQITENYQHLQASTSQQENCEGANTAQVSESDDEIAIVLKYAHYMFKELGPHVPANEKRVVLKHSYSMFTSLLVPVKDTESYRDLLQVCQLLQKYRQSQYF